MLNKKNIFTIKPFKRNFPSDAIEILSQKNYSQIVCHTFCAKKEESTYKSYVPETFNKFSNFQKKTF